MVLSEAELTNLRAASAEKLPDVVQILAPTEAEDGRGGRATSYAPAGEPVAGRLGMASTQEQMIGEREGAAISEVVTLPYDAQVTTQSRLVVNGTTYRVVKVKHWESLSIVKRALVVAL